MYSDTLPHVRSTLAAHRQCADSALTTTNPPIHLAPNPHFYTTPFVGVCISQVYQSFNEYLLYPKMTLIEEKLMAARIHQENLDTFFPAITFCNLKPLVSNHKEIARNNSIPTLDDYLNYLRSLLLQNRKDVVETLLSSGSLYTGYYSFIGPQKARLLSHQLENYIVECNFLIAAGSSASFKACHELGSNITVASTKYFNCYTIQYYLEDDPGSMAIGMSVILQHDNHMLDIPNFWPFGHLTTRQNVGSKVLLHANNSIFDDLTQGFSTTVGQKTEVQMSAVYHERLPQPHGNCSRRTTNPIYTKHGTETSYAFNPCTRACITRKIHEKCGCIVTDYVERPWNEKPKDLRSCHHINASDPNGFDVMLHKSRCQDDIKRKAK